MIEIVPLFGRAEFIPLVAEWNWEEWRDLLSSDSCAAFAEDLRARTRRDGIPITFIALDDGVPVGTSSLVKDDLPTRPELTPWLDPFTWSHRIVGAASGRISCGTR